MRFFLIALLALGFSSCVTHNESIVTQGHTYYAAVPAEAETPAKLLVGIVVDQMRWDYLTRYAEDYGEGGFKRLMDEGFSCMDHHYSFAPTFTGPGHAAVYTGTTPQVNGIIANDWYDKFNDEMVYCAGDSNVTGVGTESKGGKMSPHRMISNSMCDQVRLHTNWRGKTFGISLKDRGSILPVGHGGNAAYWMVDGDWISSSWYLESLPDYVQQWNESDAVEQLIDGGWSLLKDPSVYDESAPDNNPWEGKPTGKTSPTFPYDLAALLPENGGKDIIKGTPLGNTATLDFALEVLQQESLGQDEHLDVLAISFSATDYVGHRFGPQSREAQDTYLRLDRDIERLLTTLDNSVGEGNYVVFLTADHGAVHVPSYLESHHMAADYWNPGNMVDDMEALLSAEYEPGDYIANYSNDQVFLNDSTLRANGVDREDASELLAARALHEPGVLMALTEEQMKSSTYTDGIPAVVQRGFHFVRSGDVLVVTEPGWLKYGRTGTSHGTPFAYDTHTPCIFYGNGIPQGKTYARTHIRDIAPTLGAWMGFQMPDGCTGTPIQALFER